MRFLCWFRLCAWRHVFNAHPTGSIAAAVHGVAWQAAECGVYQCTRCKSISIGAAR